MEKLSAAMMEAEEKEILIDDLMNHYGQDATPFCILLNKKRLSRLTSDSVWEPCKARIIRIPAAKNFGTTVKL
ncbi:hypothetical protein [Jeotgalibacillus campisalis]|uniref:Uncharacterized protein n=1 Tax=Jeotgalibacillus campisalis TaxID=220754 RepID=A0A0C2VQF8_9BACL|nr:hypothetical protein [Jeotgalibacillus campisalis]KIL51142.1 hypothetical protein KR50_10230 [Jeotgalibacillus campisalis]